MATFGPSRQTEPLTQTGVAQALTPGATRQGGPPLTELWTAFRADQDPEARQELFSCYLGLVYHTANKFRGRVPQVDFRELVSAGTLGLARALDGYDCDRGTAFSTYAVHRIRGAILDDLRRRAWAPRLVRQRSRQILAVSSDLEQKLGRQPSAAEIAEALQIDLDTYWRWRGGMEETTMVSFDSGGQSKRDPIQGLEERISDEQEAPQDARHDEAETSELLRSAIASLPERERQVLALYYYEELTQQEIAVVLGVTESRISQIRTHALARLRGVLPSEFHPSKP